MKTFLEKHAAGILGVLSCFDRVMFKGHLPFGYPGAMATFLNHQGVLFKDLGKFVDRQSERIKNALRAYAESRERPWEYYDIEVRKEARAREIAERDGITEGLICALSSVEPCRSFRIQFHDGRPVILPARRKCLFVYLYFIHPLLGFMHISIQTWFPLTIQVYVNGHEWLARRLDQEGIGYLRQENAFLRIDDCHRAQAIADEFASLDWRALLDELAQEANPLMADLLASYQYYWAMKQVEYSTDVMFVDHQSLAELYPRLLQHATLCFSAEDVLTFLGRKLTPCFKGEVLNEFKKRLPGARVRHWMKGNWNKLYDKHGRIARVETVINDPYELEVRRRGKKDGKEVVDWFPLPKGVAYLPRYAEVSVAANARYLDALATVDDPSAAHRALEKLSRPAHAHGRSVRGFNPACRKDLELFQAAMRGEHTIRGFRNRDIRLRLCPPTLDMNQVRKDGAHVSRLLKRLHLHGLIAKIPRTRRWRVNSNGYSLMGCALRLYQQMSAAPVDKAV